MGSEMCIRDRINTIWCVSSKDFSLEQWREYITCLLYTSDAADDLLCVDLGGRRIIKKKSFRWIVGTNFIYRLFFMEESIVKLENVLA